MEKFAIFFDNGKHTIINADKIKDSDNYINFYSTRFTGPVGADTKETLEAQFSKSKIAGYSKLVNVTEI